MPCFFRGLQFLHRRLSQRDLARHPRLPAISPGAIQRSFQTSAPSDLAPYRQLFGGDIQFSSHSDSLKLPKALLNQRLPLADPISHLAMLKLTQARERELETSAGSAIAHEVSTLLKSDIQRYSDLKAVAQALNISNGPCADDWPNVR